MRLSGCMKSTVLRAVSVLIREFWDLALCSLVFDAHIYDQPSASILTLGTGLRTEQCDGAYDNTTCLEQLNYTHLFSSVTL